MPARSSAWYARTARTRWSWSSPATPTSPETQKLIKAVDAATAKHTDCEMGSFVVVLTDDEEKAEHRPEGDGREGEAREVVLSTDSPAGPPKYKLNKDADVTVVLYTQHMVKANHAFGKGELKENGHREGRRRRDQDRAREVSEPTGEASGPRGTPPRPGLHFRQPLPRPLPEAGRGEEFGSPFPLREGGWGVRFFAYPTSIPARYSDSLMTGVSIPVASAGSAW